MRDDEATVARTWNEFWGPLLLVRFHKEDPRRWTAREQTANWIFEKLNLRSGVRVLDLGCGDGLLDICLARLGAKVTAVDRICSVLDATAGEPDADLVEFISGDIREMKFSHNSFDLILMLELIGLMNKGDESRLLSGVVDWLTDNGRLVIDCPHQPEESRTSMERDLDNGVLRVESTYCARSRRLLIRPTFRDKTGRVIELRDRYSGTEEHQFGIVRYLYPKKELVSLLREKGLAVEESSHHSSEKHYSLIASPCSANSPRSA